MGCLPDDRPALAQDLGVARRAAPEAAPGAAKVEQHPCHHAVGAGDLVAAPAGFAARPLQAVVQARSEEHTSELQSLMRNSYAVFCLKKKNTNTTLHTQ